LTRTPIKANLKEKQAWFQRKKKSKQERGEKAKNYEQAYKAKKEQKVRAERKRKEGMRDSEFKRMGGGVGERRGEKPRET